MDCWFMSVDLGCLIRFVIKFNFNLISFDVNYYICLLLLMQLDMEIEVQKVFMEVCNFYFDFQSNIINFWWVM